STSLEKADNSEFSQKCENHISRSVNNTSLEMCKSRLQKCENHISSDVITTSLIINNTENNKTDSNNTDEREKLRRRSRKYEAENMHEKKKDEVDDNPKMTSQVQERIRWLSQDDDVIPLTPREKKMFDLFSLERKRRGKATSRVQRNTMIQNLHLYGHDEYVRLEILEKTIAKGWNDIYPLDRGAPGATNQEEGNSYGNGSI
ncbi:MAG: hypothetical protein GX099_09020, partial [Clostridiaceae bacterium]|nr:hypothetical protein [Clostridiaceae bacterium]